MESILSIDKKKIVKGLLFSYLVFFSLGQLASFGVNIKGNSIRIGATDVVVGLGAIFSILFYREKLPRWFLPIVAFLASLLVSFLVSFRLFSLGEALPGVLYLARVSSYSLFSLLVYFSINKALDREKLVNLMILVVVIVGIFGWIQYFLYPDLRSLKVFHWDDHYFRLVSTFLDPAFTGIIIVFGILGTIFIGYKTGKRPYWIIGAFLLLTLAFTYSRASYLSVGVGIFYLAAFYIKKVKLLVVIFALVVILPILPRPGGYGVRLERVHSIFLKIEDYKESGEFIKRSPVFGVGFNNLCIAKQKYLQVDSLSHSCDGFDNSFLFVFATAGIVGLVAFLYMLFSLWRGSVGEFGELYRASFIALTVHTLFTNTYFYGWVMGWMALLVGISRVKDNT